jgi:DNA-directed RNA polymerase subunit RPC12/RpoP
MNDYQRQHGNTHKCSDCGRLFTESDGGCECSKCVICGAFVVVDEWHGYTVCDACHIRHSAIFDLADHVINNIKKEIGK